MAYYEPTGVLSKRRYNTAKRHGAVKKRRSSSQHVSIRQLDSSDCVYVKLKFRLNRVSYTTDYNYVVIFYGNNINEPTPSGSLGKPTGFNEWFALYERGYVYGSKCKYTIVNQHATLSTNMVLQASAALGFVGTSPRQPNTSRLLLGPCVGARNCGTLKMYKSVEDIFGRDRSTDDGLWCTSSSGPTSAGDVWYWNLACTQLDGSANNILPRVVMTYYCKFFDRKVNLADS